MALTAEQLESFVAPFYERKDTMHDLTNIHRVRRRAEALAVGRAGQVDEEILRAAVYFHGVVWEYQNDIETFLRRRGLPGPRIDRIVRVAWESQKDAVPETLEGIILHDAHLTEGGRSFLIVKCLVTGSARGQTLAQTIDYVERNVLGKFHCYFPEAQRDYADKTAYAEAFLDELKASLDVGGA